MAITFNVSDVPLGKPPEHFVTISDSIASALSPAEDVVDVPYGAPLDRATDDITFTVTDGYHGGKSLKLSLDATTIRIADLPDTPRVEDTEQGLRIENHGIAHCG